MNKFIMTTALCLSMAAPVASYAEGMMPADVIAASEGASLGESVKIAYIDPLTGPFGPVGDAGFKQFEYAAHQVNASGGIDGHRVEVIAYDNKSSPDESLVQLQKAIDDGVRIITQGNGSAVAHALVDAVSKHNRRNPGDEVVFLNYAAVDPALTGEKCSYWHFRFDANTDMKISALVDWVATQDDIKSAYIIGQDYSHGRSVAAAAHRELAAKRPDIEIVGDELHPIARVQDFTPYVQKIISSGADVVITGNWGTDMTLLVKAMGEAGLEIPVLTFYAGGLGSPSAIGETGVGMVKQITEFHVNIPTTPERNAMFDYFETEHGLDFYYGRVENMMMMLQAAGNAAGATDAVSLAASLEGLSYEGPTGTVTMQASDHQAVQPLFISTFSADVERDLENTGYGYMTDLQIAAEDTVVPSSCEMRRP